MPKKITTPWPPQRVESASSGSPKQLSMSSQLSITQTSPAGPIARSVCKLLTRFMTISSLMPGTLPSRRSPPPFAGLRRARSVPCVRSPTTRSRRQAGTCVPTECRRAPPGFRARPRGSESSDQLEISVGNRSRDPRHSRRTPDSELRHPSLERGRRQPEESPGAIGATHAPPGQLEDAEDVAPLHVLEREARGRGLPAPLRELDLEPRTAVGQDDGSFDDVPQLADVAGPRISLELLEAALGD